MDQKPKYEAPRYRGADKLKGKVALITGGDPGAGRSVVLVRPGGADVAIVYLREEQADAKVIAKGTVEAESTYPLIPGDVSDPQFCQRAVDETPERFGKLEILDS